MGCGLVWLSNGFLIAIGGWNDQTDLRSVELMLRPWQPLGNTAQNWRFVSSMNNARTYMGTAVLKNRIIVAGGNSEASGTSECLGSVEIFTPPDSFDGNGQWTSVQDMFAPMEVVALFPYSNQLYAIGMCFTISLYMF